jgi:hypothetical protein
MKITEKGAVIVIVSLLLTAILSMLIFVTYKLVNKQYRETVYVMRDDWVTQDVNKDPDYKPPTPPTQINIPSRGVPTDYAQVGVIFNETDSQVFNLYGRQVYSGSTNWNYYIFTDAFNPIKLDIFHSNKSCLDEYGCGELMDGTLVEIKELGKTFTVKIYKDHSKYRYLP